jgi:Flp pilus assembly protein TadG
MSPRVRLRCTRARAQLAEQDGVVLVLVALMMTVMLGMAALAIDIGSFYGAQREAQSAADAAALAAAQDLPSNSAQATTDVQNYVARDDPGATPVIQYPYGNSSTIKVTVNNTTPAFFSQIWGKTSQGVSATAVAGARPAAVHAAIFAYDDSCADKGVDLEGNSPVINGGIYSNGSFTDNANGGGSLGPATYGGPNSCSPKTNGQTEPSSTIQSTTLQPYPIDYRLLPSPCDVSGQNPVYDGIPVYHATTFAWTTTGAQVPTGIYCASQSINLSGTQLNGSQVSFIAPAISFTGNNSTLVAPAAFPLLFWVTGTNTEFDVGGNAEGLTGNIFDPTGTVVEQANNSGSGFVEANDVIVTGNSFGITGTGPPIGISGYSLVQ